LQRFFNQGAQGIGLVDSFFGDLIGLREVLLVIGILIILSGLLGFRLLSEPEI
jgi:hypothetical protein